VLPDLLESPLDARIERLGVDLDDSQLDQLSKHPTERWLSRRHTPRLWLAQCNYRGFPQLCIRAIRGELDIVVDDVDNLLRGRTDPPEAILDHVGIVVLPRGKIKRRPTRIQSEIPANNIRDDLCFDLTFRPLILAVEPMK